MLPNFLIIGAPRAGSTYIHRNISLHPEIFVSTPKEVHHFDRTFEKGKEYYESFFKKGTSYKAVGEATPDYLHKPQIDVRIKEYMPDVKMIVCLRNPVDRVYSRFWNAKAKFVQNRDLSFEEKLKLKPEFIEEGFYAEHLERYFKLFPRENFLILFFDDMVADPAAFLKRIYNFLGVDPSFISPFADKQENSAASKKFLSKNIYLYYVQRAAYKLKLFGISEKLAEKNKTIIPKMSPETRKWLTNEVYLEHNKKLESLLGVDLSKWKK